MNNTSPRKVAANRANARFSTGPKTEAGKNRSKRNRLRHGLRAQEIVLPQETQAEFERLRADLVVRHQPVGPMEHWLVQRIAVCLWRSQRAIRCEVGKLTLQQQDIRIASPIIRRLLDIIAVVEMDIAGTPDGHAFTFGPWVGELGWSIEALRAEMEKTEPEKRATVLMARLQLAKDKFLDRLATAEAHERMTLEARRASALLLGDDDIAKIHRYETANDR